jgi:hypothetical protein
MIHVAARRDRVDFEAPPDEILRKEAARLGRAEPQPCQLTLK